MGGKYEGNLSFQEESFLDSSLSNYNFSKRVMRAFKKLGIETVRDLCDFDRMDFLFLRNFGERSLAEVENFLKENGMNLKSGGYMIKKQLKEEKLYYLVEKARELANQGFSRRDISEQFGMSYSVVCSLLHVAKIDVARSCHGSRISDDELRKEALSGDNLNKIAEKYGLSRERIRVIFKNRGFFDEWKKAKIRKKEEEINRKAFIGAIAEGVVQKKYVEASEAEKAAYIYLKKGGGQVKYSFSFLQKFFESYFLSREKGENISYEELSSRSGLSSPMSAWRILKTMNLPGLSGLKKNYLPEWKKEALYKIKCSDSRLSAREIADLLDMTSSHVSIYLGNRPLDKISNSNKKFGGSLLNYVRASIVYEARDEMPELSVRELSDLTGFCEKQIVDALNNREEYSKEILKNLNLILGERSNKKPYLTSEERKKIYSKKGMKK